MDESQQQPAAQSSGSDPDEELARLRERLAFYESFDQLIQDNVSRAGNLLREAATRHQDSELAIRTTTAQFEQRQLAERVEYRKIFSSLLDDVTTVQQNVERLARQVADALDDLEAVIPAAGETAALESDTLPSIPAFRAGAAGELGAGMTTTGSAIADEDVNSANDLSVARGAGSAVELDTIERESPDVDQSAIETEQYGSDQVVHQGFTPPSPHDQVEPVDELIPEDDSGDDDQFATQNSGNVAGSSSFSNIVQASVERISQALGGREGSGTATDAGETDGISVDLASTAEEGDDDESIGWVESGEPAATTLLVHGVPRATTALSLKRYLEGLEQVHSVEPREYAEGVLRLQVSSERPVRLDDLRGWPEANALELVADRDDFVEVRLSY
jgi:hypothetical protein